MVAACNASLGFLQLSIRRLKFSVSSLRHSVPAGSTVIFRPIAPDETLCNAIAQDTCVLSRPAFVLALDALQILLPRLQPWL